MSAITSYGLQMLEKYQRILNRESKENKDWLNEHGSNVNLKRFGALRINEKIGNVKERNKQKWPDLEVGGTAAESSDLAAT